MNVWVQLQYYGDLNISFPSMMMPSKKIDRLKEYKRKLILFSLKDGKHKKGMIAGGFLHISVKTNIEFGIFIYFYIISIFLKLADI